MRAVLLVGLLAGCSPSDAAPRPSFESDVRPLLEKKCQPCHFSGGVVYGRLPFDKSETIKKLGEKLFTRIRDEGDRRLVRAFLAS